jgi:hypothetical protein
MIWLTWRQFRAQIITAAATLAVLAGALFCTHPALVHLYNTSGVPTCNVNTNCDALVTRFLDELSGITPLLYFVSIGFMFAVPAIIGVFWGAPLVAREIEMHTGKLAWNQSVTRTRWLAVKLAGVGLVAMATAGLLSLMVTWWSSQIDQAVTLHPRHGISLFRLGPVLFDTRGITPIGYAAFAFALGVTAGVLIRRTVPAMAATLAGFTAVQITMADVIRQHLVAPVHAIAALSAANIYGVGNTASGGMLVQARPSVSQTGAWILSSQVIDKAGHPFQGPFTQACLGRNFAKCTASIGQLHLRQRITYLPASRYWTLQWREALIFGVLALLLAGICFWAINRRRVS